MTDWQDAAEGIAGPDGLRVEEQRPANAARVVSALDLVDADGDRIRFTVNPGRTDWPVELWIGGTTGTALDGCTRCDGWELEGALSLEQLTELITWARGVLPAPLPDVKRVFTWRDPVDGDESRVALYTLDRPCPVCEHPILAGAFVADVDGRPAHERCAGQWEARS